MRTIRMDDLKNDPHHSDEPALDYWEGQRDKLQTLSLKLLFLRPKLAGTGGLRQRRISTPPIPRAS
jgi:hypothetical protein